MAKKVSVSWVDDLDGATAADQTITFAFDGVSYEIDLSEGNAQKFRDDMQQWTQAGRRVAGTRRGRRSTGASPNQKAGEIRQWAKENGYEVSDRGRISAEVRAAYEAAN